MTSPVPGFALLTDSRSSPASKPLLPFLYLAAGPVMLSRDLGYRHIPVPRSFRVLGVFCGKILLGLSKHLQDRMVLASEGLKPKTKYLLTAPNHNSAVPYSPSLLPAMPPGVLYSSEIGGCQMDEIGGKMWANVNPC